MNVLHLCAGIDGFGLALGVTPTWVADNDPDAAAVLAHHYPNTPNLGDVKTVDWAALGTVDVLCAGYPCLPNSRALKLLGNSVQPQTARLAIRELTARLRNEVAA